MKHFARDPYLHFLIGGVLLYLLFGWLHQDTPKEKSLLRYEQQALAVKFAETWGKAPDQNTMRLIQKQYLFDDALYEEARRLELDRLDEQIHRRMVTKMKQIITASFVDTNITQATLQNFYREHLESYTNAEKMRLIAILLPKYEENQTDFVEMFNTFRLSSNEVSGFLTPTQTSSIVEGNRETIASMFGKYVAFEVWQMQSNRWHTVAHSKEERYAIYIIKREGGEPLSYDEVETRVYDDYRATQHINALQNYAKEAK